MFKYRIILILLLFLGFSNSFSQIRIKEVPQYDFNSVAENLLNLTKSRQIIPLNNNWIAYTNGSKLNSVSVNLPCAFKGANQLIFEKEFTISDNILKNKDLVLHLIGVNYTTEILLNDVVIFKNDIADIPFSVHLTRELLKSSEANNLKIIVEHELDDKKTIPPLQRFLFPENYGGITRDVYIEVLPLNRVTLNDIDVNFEDSFKTATVAATITTEFQQNNLITQSSGDYKIVFNIINSTGEIVKSESVENVHAEDRQYQISMELDSPDLWSPDDPHIYQTEIRLSSGSNEIDILRENIVIRELKLSQEALTLNNEIFHLKGITYIPNSQFKLNEPIYSIINHDLETIKELGFNTVRFAKAIPHPYAIKRCEELGLLALVEIPIHSMPEYFASDESYQYRSINLLNSFIEEFKDFSSVIAIGVGTSYISNSEAHANFIGSLAKRIKTKSDKFSYASFIGSEFINIPDLDLFGVELFDNDPYEALSNINSIRETINGKKIFISEASYPNYYGSKSGYLSQFSIEAQAKYYEDVINFSDGNKLTGFFINTFKNYYGDFTSFYTQYNPTNYYSLGLNDESDNPNRIPYKVISSKLTNSERITIPIGSTTDDSPIFIIIAGLILAILMAVLINSKKKFREDATRALLRPYNFYSDIRDQRIISGFHTIALMFILAGSHALLLTNILFYLKNNILFEKLLLAFGLPEFIKAVSYLAWNPIPAFAYSFVFSILLFVLISILIKVASFFIKSRVHFLNVFFVVIWAFLPMAILLPFKLILYRVLIADLINIYIYGFLFVYLIWIIQRIFKGVYVIFDASKTAVYFYSILLMILFWGIVLAIFQLSDSSIYYIITAFKQFQLI